MKLGLKNLAILQSYFDYIFVHRRQKVRFRPELIPKFLSTLGPNPAQTRTRPEKPGPTYNSELNNLIFFNWLANAKNLVLSNDSEHLQNVIQCHQKSFFSKKIPKIALQPEAFPPDPHNLQSVMHLSYTSLLSPAPKLDICTV